MKATVHVTLKPDVLDPQGKAIKRASDSLGYTGVSSVRQGKLFELEIDAGSADEARKLVGEMAEKLLANPVIEDYEILRLGD